MTHYIQKYLRTFVYIIFSLNLLHAADTNTTIRIMPLGDSLTYDNTYADDEKPRPAGKRTGYRSHLWYMLKDANYTADFVGSQRAGQNIKPPFDPDNEGHPGWTSFEIAEKVYNSLIVQQPDIILLHAGTNDHTTTPSGVESILNQIDYYEAICWSGLTHLTDGSLNPLFSNNYPNFEDQQDIIKKFNTENGTATYSGYSPLIDNNCN